MPKIGNNVLTRAASRIVAVSQLSYREMSSNFLLPFHIQKAAQESGKLGQLTFLLVQADLQPAQVLQCALEEVAAPMVQPRVLIANGRRMVPVVSQIP